MKHLLYIALFVFPILCYSQTDTVVVSDRVGVVLEYSELQYYQLFPYIYSRDKAVVTINEDDSSLYSIILFEEESIIEEIDLSPDKLELWREYIEMYEAIQYSLRHDIDERKLSFRFEALHYKRITGSLRSGEPFPVSVTTRDSKSVTGDILYIDSTYIVLNPQGETSLSDNPMILNIQDIDSIYYSEDGSFFTGYGITTGLITGIFGVIVLEKGIKDYDEKEDGSPLLAFFGGVILSQVFAIPIGIASALTDVETKTNIRMDPDKLEDLISDLKEYVFYKHGLPPELRTKINAQ